MARSGCIYGPTGGLKTTQVKWLARYIAEKTGKCTLLLSTDGGGWSSCQPEIDAGMIRAYRCETANLPLPLLRKISQGYWPKDVDETSPARINLTPINWNEVGGIAVEGWTSIGQAIMRYLPDAGISVGGEDRKKPNANMAFDQAVQVEGQWVRENFGSNTRGDFGFVQRFVNGLVTNFGALPVEYVLYTALESKTEDDDRSTTYGPSIEGKKATAQCGAWVGDLIHAQDYPVVRQVTVPDPADPAKTITQQSVDLTVRMYFRKHLDPVTNLPYPAKPRVTPEKLADLYKRWPGGYFEPKVDGSDSLATYLAFVDELGKGQADSLRGWRERADAKLGRGPKVSVSPPILPQANTAVTSSK